MSQRTKPQHTKGMPLSKNSLVLTFLSVCQKAPPWSVWPVCDTAAETPQKTTADSPAPPTKAETWWVFKKQKKETKHGDSKYHTKQVWRVSRNCTAHWKKTRQVSWYVLSLNTCVFWCWRTCELPTTCISKTCNSETVGQCNFTWFSCSLRSFLCDLPLFSQFSATVLMHHYRL